MDWIDSQRDAMVRLVGEWAGINSYSLNVVGLKRMAEALVAEIGEPVERIDLPAAEMINSRGEIERHELGQALRWVRGEGKVRVLLNIHYDTVYPPESGFQRATREGDVLRGPGVLDAKGGIVVLLTAVRAIEQAGSSDLRFEILLTPDEEIGSPGSGAVIVEAAKRNDLALVFEPALPDGALVDARKGSGNFTFVVRGRAAHAGRDFASGRSAILAAAELVLRLSKAFEAAPGITINCGKIEGGGPLNVVPELAIARFNARATGPQEQTIVETRIAEAVREFAGREGIDVMVQGGFHAPPKVLDERSAKLLDLAIACGAELGLTISHRASGGASDGNRIAAAGAPVIDSLGPVGAELHSEREWVSVPSLIERAKLTALLLTKLAAQM